MIRRKPEKAVPVLLARLKKAKEWAVQKYNADDQDLGTASLVSKFKDIEDELNDMKDSFPRIKLLEKSIIEQMCVLEQELYYDTFKEQKMEEDVREKLNLIKDDIVKLKVLISKVDNGVANQLRTMSFKSHYQSDMEDGDDQTVSKEWGDHGIEEKIFESEAMLNLSASFHCLESSQVKMCLMCLSIFPENTIIKKKTLIYWWIGEGLVIKKKNETAEEVGEQVFQQLLIEGFIKPSQQPNKDNYTNVNSFTVHPWIRRMLILVAQKNNFLTFSPKRITCNSSRRVFLCGGGSHRHDSYNIGSGVREEEENLWTVFNVKEQYLGIKSEWLAKLKRVEVLQLGSWTSLSTHHIEVENQEELLNGLGSQKHLKYLSLRGISRIETLPRSIVKLISLEILDLRACHNLEKLPPGISVLKNLTHLDVSECYLLESMPKGLENLLALQVLKGFVIGKEWKNSCRINDLSKLDKLRKLSIRVGSNDGGAQSQLSQLRTDNNFPALQILTISWGVISSSSSSLLSSTSSFPKTLRKLDLRCAPESLLPGDLPNLERLYIIGGNINSLKTFEGLKTVKFLRVKYLKNLETDKHNLVSSFPEYLHLEITNCGNPDGDIIIDRPNNPTVSDEGPHSSSVESRSVHFAV